MAARETADGFLTAAILGAPPAEGARLNQADARAGVAQALAAGSRFVGTTGAYPRNRSQAMAVRLLAMTPPADLQSQG